MRIGRIIRAVCITASAAISLVALVGMPGTGSTAGAAGIFTDRSARINHGARTARHSFALKYVALGDSVASGLGLSAVPGATAEDIACGRSPEAYSNIVAARLDEELNKFYIALSASSAACQGATVDNLVQNQTLGGTTVRPQLDVAYEGGAPALLTLTMGSNDVRWGQFLGACFAAANCATEENTIAVQAYIDTAKGKLIAMLREVKSRSGFIPPLVIVTGYYTPISPQCVSGGLTAEEVTWVQDQTNALNNALNAATQQHGTGWFTRFAPVDFTGHDICAADSWIQRPGVSGEPAPFHPTARGQQAIADAVETVLHL